MREWALLPPGASESQPSLDDGLSASKISQLLIHWCRFINAVSTHRTTKLKPLTIATSKVYLRRFYTRQTLKSTEKELWVVATTASVISLLISFLIGNLGGRVINRA